MKGYNKYIGARYVPLIMGDWDKSKSYEPLSVVLYQGNSYTSKTFVPSNVDISNNMFWACTGNYNVQVEMYKQEVQNYNLRVEECEEIVEYLNNRVDNTAMYYNTLEDALNSEIDKNMFIITCGRYDLNDGGDGLYIISNEIITDYYVESNGLYFNLLCGNDVPILALYTDDIGSVINNILSKGDTPIIQKGVYKLSTPILPVSKSIIDFKGSTVNVENGIKFIEKTSDVEISRFRVCNVSVNGTLDNTGIHLRHVVDSSLENILLYNFDLGIYTTYSWTNSFKDVRVQNCNKPIDIANQSNNMSFINCAFVSSTRSVSLTNAEGIDFIGCEVANNTSTNAISLYQSTLTMINCYLENLSDPLTNANIRLGWNETIKSGLIMKGCVSTPNYISIDPQKGNLELGILRKGKYLIKPTVTADDNPASTQIIGSLELPKNITPNNANSVSYFDGFRKIKLLESGLEVNIELGVLFTNPTSGTFGQFSVSVEQGANYLIYCEATGDGVLDLNNFGSYNTPVNKNGYTGFVANGETVRLLVGALSIYKLYIMKIS